MEKPFHIYRSSAGSGKTRTLAREYIRLALKHPAYFRHVLAVTFANKAAQEMKDRVIQYLGEFADGSVQDPEMEKLLGVNRETLRANSQDVLSNILHQYSQFAISTIDAFFQRVIRSFTRESGLLGNFRLEVENDLVLDEVIAELMDELGEGNPQLTKWVIEFSAKRLVEGDSWNITSALKGFSSEIFKDNYKSKSDEIQKAQESISLPAYLKILDDEAKKFMDFMRSRGQRAMQILDAHGFTREDFNYKDLGTPFRYFKDFANGIYLVGAKRIATALVDTGSWGSKKMTSYKKLTELVDTQLLSILREMTDYDSANFIRYNTIQLVRENFYSYGLIFDITRKLREYKAENNLMLISDASHFLNGVINQSDTPFIYEKVGSFFKHYLIDEFQDTSELQWKNFQPLVRDALDQNTRSLVVGDVKQSIYRWRGGDLELLQSQAEAAVGEHRTEIHILEENWRSAENLVHFNNALFAAASHQVGMATGNALPQEAFAGHIQKSVHHKGLGFIQVRFFENWFNRGDVNGEVQALHEVPRILEQMQEKGIPLRDIAILVRKNEEGQRVANYLLQYKNSVEAKPGCRYDVVSNESLRLDSASSVLLLISAMKYLNNPLDSVARGELVYEYASLTTPPTPEAAETRFSNAGKNKMQALLPEEFIQQSSWLAKLSLFELTETLIGIFQLGNDERELAYLQSFQDQILEFSALEKNDIGSFLDWWKEMKSKKSIQVAANTDAVSIYSIHKAKGMQFKFVIVPFCSWRMDHEISPLLWCKSAETPFDQLGYVAVRYNRNLEKSFFADDYREEYTKSHLDNLNLLYVACTRAEEGMFLMAPLHAAKSQNAEDPFKISTVGQLLSNCFSQSAELDANFNALTNTYSKGTLQPIAAPLNQEEFIPASLTQYPTSAWRKKLVIKREGKEFFLEEKTEQRKRINYGILMHRTLSLIKYRSDVEDALTTLIISGYIMEPEAVHLKTSILALLDHPVAGAWFKNEWTVLTEVPVILPGTSQDRIDRVVHRPIKNSDRHKAVIIDYKTGTKRSEDRKQVENYASALVDMGYADVEGYLLYLEPVEVVPVVSKANLSLEF